jgi:hypothetical protein
VKDNLDESVLPIVGVVRCSCYWCLGCNTFMHLDARHRGSSYWSLRPLCRDGECCPLACRRCCVCVGRVVVSIFCFTHVSPNCSLC